MMAIAWSLELSIGFHYLFRYIFYWHFFKLIENSVQMKKTLNIEQKPKAYLWRYHLMSRNAIDLRLVLASVAVSSNTLCKCACAFNGFFCGICPTYKQVIDCRVSDIFVSKSLCVVGQHSHSKIDIEWKEIECYKLNYSPLWPDETIKMQLESVFVLSLNLVQTNDTILSAGHWIKISILWKCANLWEFTLRNGGAYRWCQLWNCDALQMNMLIPYHLIIFGL